MITATGVDKQDNKSMSIRIEVYQWGQSSSTMLTMNSDKDDFDILSLIVKKIKKIG